MKSDHRPPRPRRRLIWGLLAGGGSSIAIGLSVYTLALVTQAKLTPPWDVLLGGGLITGFVLGLAALATGFVLLAVDSRRFLAIGMQAAGQDMGLSFSAKVSAEFLARFGSFGLFQDGFGHRTGNQLSGQIQGRPVFVCHVVFWRRGNKYAGVRTLVVLPDARGNHPINTEVFERDGFSAQCCDGHLAVWQDIWQGDRLQTLVRKGQVETVRQQVRQLVERALTIIGEVNRPMGY